MRRSIPRFLVGLFAAPLMLASSVALADPGAEACGNIELVSSASCDFVIEGCAAQCTPPSFVAACDGQCDASADVGCTGDCEASCSASCQPGSIDCEGSCTETCNGQCATSCSGDAGCESDCQLDCKNRCNVSCEVKPATCDASCKASCNASCTVQANVECHASCTVDLEGGCKVECQDPQGALFCDGQYVDATTLADCITYLETNGELTVSATCDLNGCNVGTGSTATQGGLCAASPTIGADDGRGIGAIAGVMMGIGLVISRRRRRIV